MSAINVDNGEQRTMNLLRLMGSGRLPREQAPELRNLLNDRLNMVRRQQPNDPEHEARLLALIQLLDNYIAGRIDLMLRPEMIVNLANVT